VINELTIIGTNEVSIIEFNEITIIVIKEVIIGLIILIIKVDLVNQINLITSETITNHIKEFIPAIRFLIRSIQLVKDNTGVDSTLIS
jgi:hypothetical protein